ncbi:ATP-binding cassette domain-containing protein [Verrucomicrobiales bacterium]|nr:ATP-binding cassette domain-containing protein [Verrucomicrobiales bacterium]MDC0276660.1 ATP-binding cassette domain-containing protein [Verrucomicrobiales bacterium]
MDPLVSLKNISIDTGSRRRWFRYRMSEEKLVDDVSFDIAPGQCFGLVGGEASGKLPVTFALLGLHQVSDGEIHFDGQSIESMTRRKFHPLRKHIQAVFWDELGQMNPRLTLDQAFRQVIRVWNVNADKFEILSRIEKVMDSVKLPASTRYQTPLELDPADRQLAAIARALLPEPKFLIAHEVTRGLDVVEQAQILNRICDIRDDSNLSIMVVTDDLAVAEHMSDSIGVLHHGRLLETGPTNQIVMHPEHDYTRRLVGSTVTYFPS